MSSGIGKIFAKLKQLKPKLKHPIMGLLHARSSRLTRPDGDYPSELIQDLPAVPVLDVQSVAAKLARKDFCLAIAGVEKYFSFNRERFNAEFVCLWKKEKEAKTYWRTALASDILGYVIELNKDETLFQNELFRMMMDGLGLMVDCPLAEACFFLFGEIMTMYLDREGFAWDSTSVSSFTHYVLDNIMAGARPSKYIARFLAALSESMSCDYLCLVECVRMCLVEGRELIAEEDLRVIVGAVNGLLGKFNLTAIEIVAISSTIGMWPVTENCFVVFTTMVMSRVCEMEPILVLEEPKERGSKRRLTEPVFEESPIAFLELSPESFENGVTKSDIAVVSVMDVPAVTDLLDWLEPLMKALHMISQEGLRIIVKTIIDLAYMWKEKEHKYDGFFVLLTFATEFVDRIQLDQCIDYLCDPCIFNHVYTVFDDNIPECLSLLRSMTISVFLTKMDKCMSELITRNVSHPVLAAEIMGRLCDAKDREAFLSDSCMLSILKVIWSLLQSYSESKSPAVLQALHTSLYFLFSSIDVLEDHPALYANLFQSHEFIRGYVGMVFVEVLRPMVLTRVRNFLANNRNVSLDYLCDYVCNLINICKDLEDKRCEDLVCSLSDALTYSLSHNMGLVSSFKPTLEAMLDYATAKPSLIIMDSSMKFINLMIQNTSDFHLGSTHIKQLVNVIQKVGVSDSVLLSLMNLCASATSIGNRALFLIKQPSVIPIAFAAFGNSEKLRDLTSYFIELCAFSPSNCVECHKSGIDEIFLDVIRELRWNHSKKVSFHGFVFELNFEDRDIDDLLLPFLSLVMHRSSSNVIAQKLLNLIIETRYPETAISIAHFVHNNLTNMANRIHPVFALGQKEPCGCAQITHDSLFERKFSFAFWMKIDQPISYQVQGSTKILSIQNIDDEAEHFSIVLNRDVLYIDFKKTGMSTEVKTRIASNKWIFIAFVTQTFTQVQSSAAVFMGGQYECCIEGAGISFDPGANLDVTIGGNGNGDLVALMGPFILTHTVFSEEQLQEMEKRGPSCLSDEEFFIVKTLESGDICGGSPDVVCYPCNVYKYNDSINAVLKEYNHDMTFVDLFRRLDSAPEGLIELAIGIMKFLLDPAMNYAGIMRHYLTKYSSSHLTYSLYLALYSLTDVSRSELLFDNLIVNFELWSLSPATCFSRVIHHWSNIVINTCRAMFERPKYFSKLLKMFDIMFLQGKLTERYNEAEINKLHRSFLSFIEASGHINLDRRDVEFLFQMAYQTTNMQVKIELINLCEVLSQTILECAPNISHLFHSLIDSKELDLIIASVHAIHQLASKNLHLAMLTITMQLGTIENKKQVYEVLMNEIELYPGLIVVVCGLALALDHEDKLKLLGILENVSLEQRAVEPLLQDKMWFVTPMLLFTHVPADLLYGLLVFLAKCICFISDMDERRKCFHCMITTLMILDSVIDFDFYGCVIGLMSAIDARSNGQVLGLVNDYLLAGFCRFSDLCISRSLKNEFEQSPFSMAVAGTTKSFVVQDLLTLEEIVNRDFSDFSVRFELCVDKAGRLAQDGILQMSYQFAKSNESHVIHNRFQFLMEFTEYLMERSKNQVTMTAHKFTEWGAKIADLMAVLNRKLVNSINLRRASIQKAIKRAKLLVFTDHREVLSKCYVYHNAQESVRATGPKLDQQAVEAYFMHRQFMADLTQCEKRRSLELCAHFVPAKLRLVLEGKDRDELLELSNSKAQMSEWSASSAILMSLRVTWYRFGEKLVQNFDLTKERIVLHRNLRISKTLALKDVDMVLPRGKHAIEIFAFSDCSLYLDISPTNTADVMRKFSAAHHRFGRSETATIQRFLCSATTNFDYLMILSIFNGRSFHLPENCPFLPVFDPKDPLNEEAKDVNAEQFYLPELTGETPQAAHEKRLQLEESDIAAYASRTFDHFHKKVACRRPIRKSALTAPIEKAEVVGFVGEKMMFMKQDDSLSFASVDESPDVVARTEVSDIDSVFTGSEAVVVVTKDNTIQSVRMQVASERIQTHVKISICTCDGDTVAFVGNECSVFVAKISDLVNYKRLVKSTRRIAALAINEASKILVYGTDDCKLMVHSLLTGEPTAMIDLEGSETERILIAPSWGHILVLTNQTVRVYSINGTFIHTLNLTSAIKDWDAFSYTLGVDYVVFTDARNRIGFWEVMNPKRARYHPSRLQLTAIKFSTSEGGLFAITNDGNLTFIPLAIT